MNYLTINEEKNIETVKALNTLLADYHVYYQNLRNFHWNILGENFFELHEKFEELYTDARVKIDEIAERILTLRHHPVSTMKDYLEISNINEAKSNLTDKEMVSYLLENHAIIIKQMMETVKTADDAGDEGTIDLIGAYIRELEKTSWMLNAFNTSTKAELKSVEVETSNA